MNRFLLVCLVLAGLLCMWWANAPVTHERGLEDALDRLDAGAAVSTQYHRRLRQALDLASQAYRDSFGSEPNADILRLQLTKARAAAQELIDRSPDDTALVDTLTIGKSLMTAQMLAWLKDVQDRWGLRPNPQDATHFWNRFYELPA